ncbi:hypothetical protein EV121DRAFT_297302 [Schizophyllum commune]
MAQPRPPFLPLHGRLYLVFFTRLDLPTLFACRRLSHTYKALVDAFIACRYHPSIVLSKFFSVDYLYTAFRVVQRRSGAIVSGSSALQLVSRSQFPRRDLDVYVNIHNDISTMLTFLTATIKYAYVPRPGQALNATREVTATRMRVNASSIHHYDANGLLGVMDFISEGRKVQLILCDGDPRACVLNFHSTAVMNYIEWDRVVCLYPRSTVLDRVNIPARFPAPFYIAMLEKYAARGWTPLLGPDALERMTSGELADGQIRSMYDRYCWVIPIPVTWQQETSEYDALSITSA